jgi:acetyl-CoA carboxylase carboxyl transferase subunit beta
LFKKKSAESDQVLWTTCECKNLIYKEDLEKNFNCCPKCGAHHKLSCRERFQLFFDNKEYEFIETPLPKDDPLNFVDNKKYTDRLKSARKITLQNDAVAIATGKVENIQVTVGAQDFRFIGGSFGAASGEAFIHGAQHAIDNKNPFIFFSCSGGQRMMESSIALMQMSRTVLAVNELKKNNIPFFVVLTNPTTGGVTASWAMLGDILIAEPKATIGFAGRRVIQDTVRETLPEEFQTAEYVRDHGGIDLVVERQFLRSTISTLLTVLLKKTETQAITDTSNVVTLDSSLQKSSKAL